LPVSKQSLLLREFVVDQGLQRRELLLAKSKQKHGPLIRG
jgi:hypothetical protein